MASNKSQFNRALRKWDAHHENGEYSLPPSEGMVAILCSEVSVGDDKSTAEEELMAFEAESEKIADLLRTLGIDSRIFRRFTIDDACSVIGDPDFASVVTIGNGNLSGIYTDQEDVLDWAHISYASNHLKTGFFMQRHCGHSVRMMSVPLGTFAMADHSKVYAAHNQFLPSVMDEGSEAAIKQLHTFPRLGYHAVKELFPRIVKLKDEEEHI